MKLYYQYKVRFLVHQGWWDEKKNSPIEGFVTKGWFKLHDGNWYLTEKGMGFYEKLCDIYELPYVIIEFENPEDTRE